MAQDFTSTNMNTPPANSPTPRQPNGLFKPKGMYEHGNIKMIDNVFFYENQMLQISNISHTFVGELKRRRLHPAWVIVGLASLVVLIWLHEDWYYMSGLLTPLLLVFLACAGMMIARLLAPRYFGLTIQMNSGFELLLYSPNRHFLFEMQTAIVDRILGHTTGVTLINLDNRTIVGQIRNDGGNVVVGDGSITGAAVKYGQN